jgi:hypothetical protein
MRGELNDARTKHGSRFLTSFTKSLLLVFAGTFLVMQSATAAP